MSGSRRTPISTEDARGETGNRQVPRRKKLTPARARLERRVVAVAQAALDARGFVTPVEVLVGIGWLDARHVERWRRGQVPYLERVATANLSKLGFVLRALARWADARGLNPRETVYVSWTRDRHRLRFSKSGDKNVERAYCTHWVSPQLRAAKRARQERAAHDDGGPHVEGPGGGDAGRQDRKAAGRSAAATAQAAAARDGIKPTESRPVPRV